VTGALVADAVPLPAGWVRFLADKAAAPAVVVATAKPGDVVITLGAGDVTEIGPAVLARLEMP
jgi:UDP-N-acetylmuramate--alanine ligase